MNGPDTGGTAGSTALSSATALTPSQHQPAAPQANPSARAARGPVGGGAAGSRNGCANRKTRPLNTRGRIGTPATNKRPAACQPNPGDPTPISGSMTSASSAPLAIVASVSYRAVSAATAGDVPGR